MTLDFVVSQPADSLKITATKTNIICANLNSGKIDLIISGGTSPYKYVWSNGRTTQNISDLATGSYSVSITDANGCTKTIKITLIAPTCTKPTGIISGTAFIDKDGGNTQTTGDLPAVGITVYLLDSLGNKIDSTQTDSDGKYSFTVPVGTYLILMIPPAGQTFVKPKSGNDPTKDSDVGTNGQSTPITLTTANSVVDGGIVPDVCSVPFEATAISATCINGNKNIDGKIVISGFAIDLKYDIIEASSYTLSTTYKLAKNIPDDGVLSKGLASPASPKVYTIRVFSAAGCVTDKTVILQSTSCECPPAICLPLTIRRKRV